ncbi:glucokinase [Colwellia echini]|uniref:Glucokinase n=1 Tax=Colwellia echini TaxID=1982103 RepID=A0ABY3MXA1_9GAMM|nr:glucokinase [Colwellia echini]TYK65851.1 glucokinase [Colwellia echini]
MTINIPNTQQSAEYSKQTNTIHLIADIGGTNIRLAQASANNDSTNHASTKIDINEIETYQCKEFASLADVVAHYIEVKSLSGFNINACLAIACPVDEDLISMTNLPWKFSQKELKATLKLNELTFINDYTAIAMSIPLLSDQQKVKIGGGSTINGKPISVCGPGTGLGVANLVPLNIGGKQQWHCISGEGGHIDFAAINDQEKYVLNFIQNIKKRVSYEQLLSGYGLEQIYQALVAFDQANQSNQPNQSNQSKGTASTTIKSALLPKEITANALNGSCNICEQTLSLFCEVLGSFAGNLALIMNSQGGVYIAGGIVPRFIDYLQASNFRKRFEAKGRLSHITEQAPTYVITEEQPGLLGAAAFILQSK